MNAGTTIRKILFITFWVVIGSGMLTLLLAAIGKKNRGLCKDYVITIKGAQHNFFVNEKEVQELLLAATGEKIKGRTLVSFNLHNLEKLLEENTWIRNAELYFDNRDVLHITIIEREPVARVFTTTGRSFYIDSSGRQMPLSDKLSARVPVFTGFPERKVLMRKDSVLLMDIRSTAQFIFNDPFWMAQVAQVDIVQSCGHQCWHFEMVPVIGDHLVKLGNGENIEKKFHRLFVFYKRVLSKTGFNKYKLINVEYTGQVIALKENARTKVDSVQLRKNVERLLRQSRELPTDSFIAESRVIEKSTIQTEKTIAPTTVLEKNVDKNTKTDNPDPVKTISKSNSPGSVEKKIPKAVMPKRER